MKLYVGLKLSKKFDDGKTFHYPLIKVVPRSFQSPEIQAAFNCFACYTDIILTSQSTVKIFFEALPFFGIDRKLKGKYVVAVGQATAGAIVTAGGHVDAVPQMETSEGVVSLLQQRKALSSFFFWPHSSLSRNVIAEYFVANEIPFKAPVFYETQKNTPFPIPDLHHFDEIIFTSPSTVDSFLSLFGFIPWEKKITPIGQVTARYLDFCRR